MLSTRWRLSSHCCARMVSAMALCLLSATAVTAVPVATGTPQQSAIAHSGGTSWDATDQVIARLKPAKARKKLNLLVIPVYWSGNGKDGTSRGTLKRKVLIRTDKALRAASSGRLGVKGTVTPWVKVSSSSSCSQYSTLARRAVAAAARERSTYRASRYDRVVLYFPQDDCQWSGLAQLGVKRSNGTVKQGQVVWLNGTTSAVVATHELAHTLGLPHANAIRCSGSHTILRALSRCRSGEYGDLADLMASSTTQGTANAAYLYQLKWLTSAQVKKATRRTTQVTLVPLASSLRGRKAIRVAGSKRTYWVEYRTKTGLDRALSADLTGVVVHLQPSWGTTYALDMQPQNGTTAISLPAGASWTSPDGIRIAVTSLTGSAARVTITRHASRSSKPGAPSTPSVVAGVRSATVTVTKSLDHGSPIQSWRVTATPVGGGAAVHTTVLATAKASATVQITGLTAGQPYTLTAVANNERGASPASRASTPFTPEPVVPNVDTTNP